MCGIHGHIKLDNMLSSAQCGFIKDGFIAGALRGMDSSGIFQLDKKFKAYTHKKAIAGPDFAQTKMTERYIKDVDQSRATVCHLRHATQGKVEEDNAHPFEVETPDGHWIVGVHNGTLTNWKHKPGGKDYNVDSEWAMAQIAARGYEAFKDIEGAYCFVWWDSREKDKLFMCRNSQRPMHFRLSADKTQMFFGSEAGMLAWLTERNDVKPAKEIYSLQVEQIYEFDMSKREMTWSKVPVPKRIVPVPVHSTAVNNTTVTSAHVMTRFLDGVKKAAAGARDVLALELAENVGKKKENSGGMTKAEKEEARLVIEDIDDVVSAQEKAPVPLVKTTDPLDLSDLHDLVSPNDAPQTESETDRVIREVAEAVSEGLADDPTTGTTGGSLKAPEGEDWVAKPEWYDSSLVTIPEQATAAFWNLTGEVHWFHGTSFDPDTDTVYGEVRDYVSGKGHVEYAAVIRGVNARAAHARYINNKDPVSKIAGDYAVIAGINEDPVLGRVMIMCELTKDGLVQYKKKAN